MSPTLFKGVLESLQQTHEGKFLEALAELEKTANNDLTPEELLFSTPNPLHLSRKFSTPSLFLSQPSFNDLLPTNPQLQLPRNIQLTLSTLDKVVMESLLLAKPKESSSNQHQKTEEKMPRMKNSQKSSPTRIPAHLCSFNIDSNAIASINSIMSSSRSKQANELNLAFCHDWWFANESRSQPVETKMPSESKSSTNQVSRSASKTSRSDIPTASKSTPGRASKRQASCSSENKFSTGKGNLITPSSSHSTLQTVKIMLNTDQDMTDGSDGESTSANNTSRKLPNTHKKGQPSMLASSQQSSSCSRRQRQRQPSRASRTRSVSARSSRISNSRAPRLRKFARGRKRAPKH